jgi:hypothetical protein
MLLKDENGAFQGGKPIHSSRTKKKRLSGKKSTFSLIVCIENLTSLTGIENLGSKRNIKDFASLDKKARRAAC